MANNDVITFDVVLNSSQATAELARLRSVFTSMGRAVSTTATQPYQTNIATEIRSINERNAALKSYSDLYVSVRAMSTANSQEEIAKLKSQVDIIRNITSLLKEQQEQKRNALSTLGQTDPRLAAQYQKEILDIEKQRLVLANLLAGVEANIKNLSKDELGTKTAKYVAAGKEFTILEQMYRAGNTDLKVQEQLLSRMIGQLQSQKNLAMEIWQIDKNDLQLKTTMAQLMEAQARLAPRLQDIKKQLNPQDNFFSAAPTNAFSAFLAGTNKAFLMQMQSYSMLMPINTLMKPLTDLSARSVELSRSFTDMGGPMDKLRQSTERVKAAQDKLAMNENFTKAQTIQNDITTKFLETLANSNPGFLAFAGAATKLAPTLQAAVAMYQLVIIAVEGYKSVKAYYAARQAQITAAQTAAANTMLTASTRMAASSGGGILGKVGIAAIVAAVVAENFINGNIGNVAGNFKGINSTPKSVQDQVSAYNYYKAIESFSVLGFKLEGIAKFFESVFDKGSDKLKAALEKSGFNPDGTKATPKTGIYGQDKIDYDTRKRDLIRMEQDIFLQRQDMEIQLFRKRRELLQQSLDLELEYSRKIEDVKIKAAKALSDYAFKSQKLSTDFQKFNDNFEGKQQSDKYAYDRAKAQRDFDKEKADKEAELLKTIARNEQDYLNSKADKEKAFYNKTADEALSFFNKLSDAAAQFAKDQQRKAEDFAIKMSDKAVDFKNSVFDLIVGGGSGIQLYQKIRDYNLNKSRDTRDYNIGKTRDTQDFNIQQGIDTRDYNKTKAEQQRDFTLQKEIDTREYYIKKNREIEDFNIAAKIALRDFEFSQTDAAFTRQQEIDKMNYDRSYQLIALKLEEAQLQVDMNFTLQDLNLEYKRTIEDLIIARNKLRIEFNNNAQDESITRQKQDLNEQRTRENQNTQLSSYLYNMWQNNPQLFANVVSNDPTLKAAAEAMLKSVGDTRSLKQVLDEINAGIQEQNDKQKKDKSLPDTIAGAPSDFAKQVRDFFDKLMGGKGGPGGGLPGVKGNNFVEGDTPFNMGGGVYRGRNDVGVSPRNSPYGNLRPVSPSGGDMRISNFNVTVNANDKDVASRIAQQAADAMQQIAVKAANAVGANTVNSINRVLTRVENSRRSY
jgi:hypothetical protein